VFGPADCRMAVKNATSGAVSGVTGRFEYDVVKGTPPTLTADTLAADNIVSDGARLNGNLRSLGVASDADVNFEYRQVGSSTWVTTSLQNLSSTGTFSDTVSSLATDTQYEFRARAETTGGSVDRGTELTFTTGESLDITTVVAQGVTSDSADLEGSLDDLGGASSADCSFKYREVGASSFAQTSPTTLSATGNYIQSVSGLPSDTDIEFKAVADASDGDSDTGSIQSFTTAESTSGTIVDDFEDGNITTKASNWDGWNQDTGAFSATGSALSGSFSGALDVSSGDDKLVRTNADNAGEYSEVTCLMEIDNLDGSENSDGQAFRTEGPDLNNRDFVSGVLFRQNGVVDDINGTNVGSWSANTTYRVRLSNHDYSADTYDLKVIRISDSTVVASATGVAFANSVSGIQSIRLRSDFNSGDIAGATTLFDDIEVLA